MRILKIIRGTTVDGPGFRTSIYVAGCLHKCKGCHNPESWDFSSGDDMSVDEIMNIVKEEDFDVTLSGGDPLYHADDIMKLASRIKDLGHTVWLYTGFRWEEIITSVKLKNVLKYIDVVVDSPFIESLKNQDLLFRGSSNQRIIDVRQSLYKNEIIEWSR